MASFSTCLHRLLCWWPSQTAMYHPIMRNLDLYPDMKKTSATQSLGPYGGKSVHSVLQNICAYLCGVFSKVIHHCMSVIELLNVKMFLCTSGKVVMTGKKKTPEVEDWPEDETWKSQIKMATIFLKTVHPQTKAMIKSDQMAVAEILLSDWLECQSEEQEESDDGSDSERGWSEEEDEGVSEMSSENRELWESFLNSKDPYNPLHFSCSTEDKVKASDDDHHDDEEEEEEEPIPTRLQETDETEWSEEEDCDWSDEEDLEMSAESRELWESFNSDPYNPLCFSCPPGVKKASEIKQNHTPSRSTARGAEEHSPEQSTKERAKKVDILHHVLIVCNHMAKKKEYLDIRNA